MAEINKLQLSTKHWIHDFIKFCGFGLKRFGLGQKVSTKKNSLLHLLPSGFALRMALAMWPWSSLTLALTLSVLTLLTLLFLWHDSEALLATFLSLSLTTSTSQQLARTAQSLQKWTLWNCYIGIPVYSKHAIAAYFAYFGKMRISHVFLHIMAFSDFNILCKYCLAFFAKLQRIL